MGKLESETAAALEARRKILSKAIVARHYVRQPEAWTSYRKRGREASQRDVEYHLDYLIESIRSGDPAIFSHYLDWLKTLFQGLQFPKDTLPVMLDCVRDVLREEMPAKMEAVVKKHLEIAGLRLDEVPSSLPSHLDEASPLGRLARDYLNSLLAGDKPKAIRLIINAVEGGETIKNIYLGVFQPVQREVGRLWHLNKVSVAQEHFVSAATQLIISQLYLRIFSTEKTGRRLVAACVSRELHEIGIRMVADFFEMSGWDTYYLGANLPSSSVVGAVKEYQADMLALSCTIPVHQGELGRMIARLRSAKPGRELKIIVGGYALNTRRDAWKRTGADGYAGDAEEAVRLAQHLLEGGKA
jgi:methanogenic corrinoid protein MtbC1